MDPDRNNPGRLRVAAWMPRLFRWVLLCVATYAVLRINTEPVLILAVVLGAGTLYLWTFKLPVVQRVAAVGLAAATLACWWVLYGRLTPFLEIWEFRGGEQPEPTTADILSAAWWVSVVGVALLLAGHAVLRPSSSAARGLAAWAWFGVSLWAADRGDQDGLWVLYAGVLAIVVAAMLLASKSVAFVRNRHNDARSLAED